MGRDVTVSVSQVDRAEARSICTQERERTERGALKVVCNKARLLFVGYRLIQPARDVVVIRSLVSLNACAARSVGIRQEIQVVLGDGRDQPGRDDVVGEVLPGYRVHKLYRGGREFVVRSVLGAPVTSLFGGGRQQAQLIRRPY